MANDLNHRLLATDPDYTMPSETETLQKCESSCHFKPLDEYSEDGNGRIFEYSNGLRVESKVLSGVIMTDYFFRMVVQLFGELREKTTILTRKGRKREGVYAGRFRLVAGL